MTNSEESNYLMQLTGLACTFVVAVFSVVLIFQGIKELINIAKRKYRYKHRFDKPPTAKCYCIDCKNHDSESHECYKFKRWRTADNWFCWDAEPREKE